MKFRIIGADRVTGEETSTIVNAPNESEAEKWANDNGILWSEIESLEMIHCPGCNNLLHYSATVCGGCGQKMTPRAIAPTPEILPSSATLRHSGAMLQPLDRDLVFGLKFAGGFLVLLIFACILWPHGSDHTTAPSPTPSYEQPSTPPTVTKERHSETTYANYLRIKEDMGPWDVSRILDNFDEEEQNSTDDLKTILWRGPNGSMVVATFRKNCLVSKSQIGLK